MKMHEGFPGKGLANRLNLLSLSAGTGGAAPASRVLKQRVSNPVVFSKQHEEAMECTRRQVLAQQLSYAKIFGANRARTPLRRRRASLHHTPVFLFFFSFKVTENTGGADLNRVYGFIVCVFRHGERTDDTRR